jgi:hypothetical protein
LGLTQAEEKEPQQAIDLDDSDALKKKRAEDEKNAATRKLQDDMKVFEDVKAGINVIRRNIALINELKIQSNKTVDVKDFQGWCYLFETGFLPCSRFFMLDKSVFCWISISFAQVS